MRAGSPPSALRTAVASRSTLHAGTSGVAPAPGARGTSVRERGAVTIAATTASRSTTNLTPGTSSSATRRGSDARTGSIAGAPSALASASRVEPTSIPASVRATSGASTLTNEVTIGSPPTTTRSSSTRITL